MKNKKVNFRKCAAAWLLVTVMCVNMLPVLAGLNISMGSAEGAPFHHYDQQEIEKIWGSMEERTDEIVKNMAENPFPSPVEGSGADYGIGMISYAMGNLYLNQNLETCQEYLQHVNEHFNYQIPHTGDHKTYFQMTMLLRIWFLFSSESIYYPGRLTPETEKALLEYFWGFVSTNSRVEDAKLYGDDIYYLQSSGNHHVIKRTSYLLGNQILRNQPKYKEMKLGDGYTPQEHYDAWLNYWKHDIVDRGKRALEVEYAANGYYKYTMDCFMTLREFSESSVLRELSQKYLDVIFADIAVQTDNGLYGGARGRSTRDSNASTPVEVVLFSKWFNTQSAWRVPNATDPMTGESMADRYGIENPKISYHPNLVACAASTYLPLQPLADLVLNYGERGTYEYISRPPGRGNTLSALGAGYYSFEFPSNYIRYSYVTPWYVVGGSTIDRALNYNDVCGQNRQYGIHYTTPEKQSSALSRVFPESERNYSRGFHDLNSVVYKNTMIASSLPEARYYDASVHSDIYICFTADIYETIEEEDGWIFGYVPDGDGYIAVKPTKGKVKEWKDYQYGSSIKGAHFTERRMPVIMQAGSSSEYGTYQAFKEAVKNTSFTWNSFTELEYKTINGDVLTIYTDTTCPKINGKDLDLEPENMIASPYLNGEYGTGVYQLTNMQEEKYTVTFTYDDANEVGVTKMKNRGFIQDWNGEKLTINGSFVSCEQPPVKQGNTYLIPVREAFEALDAQVSWDEAKQTTVIDTDRGKLELTLNQTSAKLNGQSIQLDAAPCTIEEKTMVSANLLKDFFDARVRYEEENKELIIWKGLAAKQQEVAK